MPKNIILKLERKVFYNYQRKFIILKNTAPLLKRVFISFKMLTEVFWVSFVSTVTGMIIALARICYKSKCRQVDICCVHVFRDTVLEVQEEANRIEHVGTTQTSNSPSSPQTSSRFTLRRQNSDSYDTNSAKQIEV